MPESRRSDSIDEVKKTQVEVDEKTGTSTTDHHIQERQPPDGGIAWLILLGCFFGLFSTQGYGYSWGVFLKYYNKNVYPNEMTNLTWIGSLWFGLTNITGPIYVYLVGKMGYRWMIGIACILSALAMMLASITNSIWQLYITQGVMSGIGSSLAWFPCISAPQQWFDKRRGLAVGMAISGSGIGGLVLSNVVQAAIQSVGYQWALRILGFIQFALLAFATAVVMPLNPLPKNVPIFDFKPLKNKQFLILLGIHFIGNFAFYIPSSFVPSYADYMGLDPWIGTNLSAIMSAIMFVGKIGNGFIADYIGRANMVVICGAMAGIVHLAIWLTATTSASVWAFAVLYGWFGGGYIAMITAVIVQVVGLDQIEGATGWAFFAWMFGGLFGQPISSAIINRTAEPDYHGAIIFAGVLFLFGACLAVTLRIMQGGWKILVKV